jgi:hypothetical protein
MTIRIATQVLRIVEREVACGYSTRDAINRAAADLGIDAAKVVSTLQWRAAH